MKINNIQPAIKISNKVKKGSIAALFFLAAYFLANAVFFTMAVPFFMPLWAIVRNKYLHARVPTIMGGLLGALSLNLGQFFILILQFIFFQAISKQKAWKLPIFAQVAISTFVGQVVWQTAYYQQVPSTQLWLEISIEVVLAIFMTLFLQNTLFNWREFFDRDHSIEKDISLFIVLATILTGMSSVQFGLFNLSLFLFHFILCMSALYMPINTAIIAATMIGTIQAIANLSFTTMISLPILTVLIAALCRTFGKLGIAVVSILPTIFYYIYDVTLPIDTVYFVSIFLGVGLFLALPQFEFNEKDDMKEGGKQEIENIRQTFTQQIADFQHFVYAISDTILEKTDPFNNTTKSKNPSAYDICQNCFRYNQCWTSNNDDMRFLTQKWTQLKTTGQNKDIFQIEQKISKKCAKPKLLIEEMTFLSLEQRLDRQFYHGKKMLALRLVDFAQHLDTVFEEMNNRVESLEQQKIDIMSMLQQQGFHCKKILINDEDERKIQLIFATSEPYQIEDRNEIEKIVSSYYNEDFQIQYIDTSVHLEKIELMSCARLQYEYDVFSKSKNRGVISGDAHRLFQMNQGLLGVLLSDGMGHDKQARLESEQIIQWMYQFLRFQIQPETAMHTIHYLQSLNSSVDMYATMDMALIDLNKGRLYSWKAGGMSTYIVRGNDVFKVNSFAPPIGAMPQFYVEMNEQELKSNDMILIVSDGLFSQMDNVTKQEQFFIHSLKKLVQKNLSISSSLYELMDIYNERYTLSDDCTVILIKVMHPNKDWAILNNKEEVFI